MRLKLQLVICNDEGHEETVTDVITLNKNTQRIEHLGLTLAESKQLLSTLQHHLLQQQIHTFLDTHSTCPDCGTPLGVKAYGSRSFRTLFGTFKLSSPRLEHCDCQQRKTSSFRPLSALLTESVAPELLYMEAKWSSLVSYGMSLNALQDFLPLDLTLDVKTVRYDTLKVARRLEAELEEEESSFIDGSPSDWELLPPPEGSFKVGIDGGYVRNWFAKKHHFEVIVGKSTLSFGEAEETKAPSHKRLGFVQTLDTKLFWCTGERGQRGECCQLGIGCRRADLCDRRIGSNEGFTERRQSCTTATASPRRGFKDRLMKTLFERIKQIPGAFVAHAEFASCG
jgi:hypothetical protein